MADEIITSRAKRRIRVGNTDAEGRMAMVDLLCSMKEKVCSVPAYSPHLATRVVHRANTIHSSILISLCRNVY